MNPNDEEFGEAVEVRSDALIAAIQTWGTLDGGHQERVAETLTDGACNTRFAVTELFQAIGHYYVACAASKTKEHCDRILIAAVLHFLEESANSEAVRQQLAADREEGKA